MTAAKQALVRPVEITASNNTLTVTWTGAGGGGPTAVNVPVGLYSSYYDVLDALSTALTATDVTLSAYMNSDHKTVIAASAGVVQVTFTDEALGRFLGYRETTGGAAAETATDTPQNCWIPTYYSYDDQRFFLIQRDSWRGGKSVVGRLAGVKLTTDRYGRTIQWDANPATNVSPEAAQVTYQFNGAGDYYQPQAERCFEQFINDCRTATLQATTSENLNPKGCYYIHDWSGYISGAHPTSMDSGGINFDLLTNPDTYVFCSPPTGGISRPNHVSNTAKNYYSVEVELTTATAPTWNVP
jgi:hypothetical protein